MKIYLKYVALASILFASCEAELENPIDEDGFYVSGDADFSNFVAVGNSLTAGYADGALYITGQENSLPNIMAGQFALAGGGEFNQPLMADNLGGLKLNGNIVAENRFVLTAADATNPIGPARLAGDPMTDVANTLSGSFNNYGVPGAKSFHLGVEGYGNAAGVATGQANPYFARFASSANASVIGDAMAQSPTFFSLWIGNNDILSYATSGGIGVDRTGNLNPATYGPNDITDPNVFEQVYNELVTTLSGNTTGGVVFNIPDVTAIPYFTTVPYNAIPLNEATAEQVNEAYKQYNDALGLYSQVPVALGGITPEEADRRMINFQAGQNAVVIEDENLTALVNPTDGSQIPKIRQATPEDLITLPASSVLGTLANPNDPTTVRGVGVPLGDQYVLLPEEQLLVTNAQTSYNATIQALAQANGLAFVDVKATLNQLANGGITYDAGTLTSTFATGGAFSLDGVHPTPRGYAYLANLAIDAINNTYGSTVPKVNVGNYNTITVSNDVNQ